MATKKSLLLDPIQPEKRRSHKRPEDPYFRNETASKSRSQMVIRCLGFKSFWELAAVAGISHVTCASMIHRPGRQTRPSKFNLLLSAFRDAYAKREKSMMPPERKFIKAWLRHWATETIMYGVARENRKRQGIDELMDPKDVARRQRRQQARLNECLQMIEGF